MTQLPMNEGTAKKLIQSLLKRLVGDQHNNFSLLGPITSDERDALLLLCDSPNIDLNVDQSPTGAPVGINAAASQPVSPSVVKYRFGSPPDIHNLDVLNLDCLKQYPNNGDVVSVDFGTAYSKAAIWGSTSSQPVPLDLSKMISDRSGLLLPSTLYITDHAIYFGQRAIEVSRHENDPNRRRFDSPKQELSILEGADLDGIADLSIDPSHVLTRRELIVLFLSFLSYAVSESLIALHHDKYAARRFAVPVWKDGQLAQVAKLLKRLMVDAQIVADTLPARVWSDGIKVEDARHILQQIRSKITDVERDQVTFVERHVLEAAASAAAIEDQIVNKRPNVLVVDIGAGTTDLGFYRFVLPQDGHARIYPYKNGGSALKIAGDRLDAHLVSFIRKQAGIDEHAPDGQRSMYVVKRDIRDLKRGLFQNGTLVLEDIGDVSISVAAFMRSEEIISFGTKFKSEVARLIKIVGVENIKTQDGIFVVLTGGGANVPVFYDAFAEAFEIDGKSVSFQRLEIIPNWTLDADAATQEIFPQLAVAAGACSPSLPDEKNPISDTAVAPRRSIAPMYK